MLLSLEFVFSLILMLVWRVVQQSGSGMGPGLLDQRTQSASTSTILNTTNQHVEIYTCLFPLVKQLDLFLNLGKCLLEFL